MRWVMEAKGWSEREWARRAELKEMSNVNKLLKRAEIDPERIPGDANTFAALAKAASVSLDWLALGHGSPVPADLNVTNIPDDPKYPTRPGVIAAGHMMGFPPTAIAAIATFDAGPVDPGQDFWLQLLLGKRAELSRVAAHQLSDKS
jgi:hypothetical protein